jgi:hypothetical protein
MNIFLSLLIFSDLWKLIYVADVFPNLLLNFFAVFDDENFVLLLYIISSDFSCQVPFYLYCHVY